MCFESQKQFECLKCLSKNIQLIESTLVLCRKVFQVTYLLERRVFTIANSHWLFGTLTIQPVEMWTQIMLVIDYV